MSSKKPFEHIEEKIKQAAENSLPAFDEKAWQAMEAKLDKDNKKRRPLLWWFILPLALAGAWGVYYSLNDNGKIKSNTVVASVDKTNFGTNDKQNDTQENSNSITGSNSVTQGVSTGSDITANNASTKKQQNPLNNFSQLDIASNKPTLPGKHNISGNRKGRLYELISGAEPSTTENGNAKSSEAEPIKEEALITPNKPDKEREEVNTVATDEKNNKALAQQETIGKQIEKKEGDAKEEKPKPAETKKKKNDQTSRGLYVIAAGGADAGSTRFLSFSNSSVTPKYGIGIGYQFNKRWSVQTGFYAANKKYVAAPSDYTLKAGSPMGAYPLEKIKAACLVYEIPLSVRYNVINKPALTLYATVGASSYIMKKENYDCFYRYYNNVYEHNWYYNGNRHLFSTAVFSFGIEKSLSNKFSLLGEPSVSVPLTGVGDGKMKIYSSALLLGIKYYPFKK